MAGVIKQFFTDVLKTTPLYPKTLTKAVVDETTGKSLDNTISEINNNLGKLTKGCLYLGTDIEVTVDIPSVGWQYGTDIPQAPVIQGYTFDHWIFKSNTYRVGGCGLSGSTLTYFVIATGTSATITCTPVYRLTRL